MLTDDERKTINHAADVLGPSLRDLATRLRAIAAPRVATVGELLATAPVGAIVEYRADMCWCRSVAGQIHRVAHWIAPHGVWSGYGFLPGPLDLRLPARTVPASEADRDPATRGPIGEG